MSNTAQLVLIWIAGIVIIGYVLGSIWIQHLVRKDAIDGAAARLAEIDSELERYHKAIYIGGARANELMRRAAQIRPARK